MDSNFPDGLPEMPKFSSPEEELRFLREALRRREAELSLQSIEAKKEDIAQDLVSAYKEKPAEEVLHPSHQLPKEEVGGIVLRLAPERHDTVMSELMTVMMERGVRNALSVVEKMNNPHVDDDFHRFLVEYLATTHELPGLKPGQELYKQLDMKLFEITLPENTVEEDNYKKMIGLMDQFYAGMQSVGPGQNPEQAYYTLELAVQNNEEHVVFYACIPSAKASLFEKQILGLYQDAKIQEVTNDYNIFSEHSISRGSVAKALTKDILQLKTYDAIGHDPLQVLLNVFTKIKAQGEGAAIQFVVKPAGDRFIKEYGKVLARLKKGDKLDDALGLEVFRKEAKIWGKAIWDAVTFSDSKMSEDDPSKKKIDDDAVMYVGEKLKSTIMETNIRIVTSAESDIRAEQILREIESAFNQFTESKGGGITFTESKGKDLKELLHNFSYRAFSPGNKIALNIKELSTIFHFPASAQGSPTLKQAKAGSAPAPIDMGAEGVYLGTNEYRGSKKSVYFKPKDRLRHFYTIGQTGVGKTQLFLNMIIQDIKNGDGCCFIDPHGSDINTILANIPPERYDDVIYFDPASTDRPMGLNFLEYDPQYAVTQKPLVISELFSIFDKLFDMKAQGGAMFGQYFRNAAGLVMEHPESGNTLLEITRVLQDKAFREMKLMHCKNPIIKEFWRSAEQTTGDQALANFVPYISSKFDDFISNDIMRPVVLQETSSFNFRKVMDEKKILLVNLSKGRLGERNASLIGLVLVGKLQMAALSRADSMNLGEFPPFYVYIDEFQNVVTDSISSILSEARKYKLILNITHQFLDQLDPKIKSSVFGNVGSMGIFRIEYKDAKEVEPRLNPVFTADDIVKQDNMNCYMSMLIDGRPAKAFNLLTEYCPNSLEFSGDKRQMLEEKIEKLKQLSFQKFGRPREEIEAEILKKYTRNNG
jgi:hypothetical protein